MQGHIAEFLHNLPADRLGLIDIPEFMGKRLVLGCGLVESIDEHLRIEKNLSAHSFPPG